MQAMELYKILTSLETQSLSYAASIKVLSIHGSFKDLRSSIDLKNIPTKGTFLTASTI